MIRNLVLSPFSPPESPVTAPSPTTARRGGPAARRGGFTLLELLIAISIIALLLALLVPAIRQVMGTANDTVASAEIKGIEGGLSQFHQMYGTMPPSFLDLRRNAGGFVNPATMPALRQVFGTSIDQGAMITSLNSAGFPGAGAANFNDFSKRGVLRGAECLVFFLGGLPANGELTTGPNPLMTPGTELAGFSKNPRDPFNVSNPSPTTFVLLDKNRRAGPFYAFNPDRLQFVNDIEGSSSRPVDSQSLSYFTYVDGFSAQETPLIYTSSNGGRGYPTDFGANGVPDVDANGVWNPVDDGPLGPYPDVNYAIGPFATQDLPMALTAGPYRTASDPDVRINPNGYQIISPGQDGEFGAGGTYSSDDGYAPAGRANDGGEDNVTNFSAGSLGG